jgi:hypothetical protein
VRRGGRVVLADDDHQVLRLWPEPPGFMELWHAYIRAYEHLGCDPFVGRRLVALLRDAGAKPRRNHWIFFGSCAGAPEFPAFVRNAIGVIETAREVITGPLGFSTKQFDRTLRAMRQWGRRSDAALWYRPLLGRRSAWLRLRPDDEGPMFGIWGLGFIWSLELGIWSLPDCLTTNHERSKIRLLPVAEEPRLHFRGRAQTGARYRPNTAIFSIINVVLLRPMPRT